MIHWGGIPDPDDPISKRDPDGRHQEKDLLSGWEFPPSRSLPCSVAASLVQTGEDGAISMAFPSVTTTIPPGDEGGGWEVDL